MGLFGSLTLFWRACLGAALVSVVTGLVASASLYAELRTGMGHGVEQKLTQYLVQIATAAADELDAAQVLAVYEAGPTHPQYGPLTDKLRAVQKRFGVTEDIYTLHLEQDHTRFGLTAKSTPLHGERYQLTPLVREVSRTGEVRSTGVYEDDHGAWISAYAPVVGADGKVVAIVEADHDVGPYLRDTRARLLSGLGVAVPIGVLIAVLLGIGYARSISAPIAGLVEAADKVSQGDVDDVEVPRGSGPEMARLSEAFERMMVAVRYYKYQLSEAEAEAEATVEPEPGRASQPPAGSDGAVDVDGGEDAS